MGANEFRSIRIAVTFVLHGARGKVPLKKWKFGGVYMARKTTATQSAPAANPFLDAPKVATVHSIDSKKKGKQRDEVEIEGLKKVAALKLVADQIKNEADMRAEEVKAKAIEHYVDLMVETGRKPESFVGVEDNASASCEIRKRGSNLSISEETAQKLVASGVSVEKKIKVEQRLVINPNLGNDELVKIKKVLDSNAETKNMQIVMVQPEEFTYVTTENTIDELASTRQRELIAELVEAVASFAVGKYKIDSADPKADALAIIKQLGFL